MYKNYLYLLRGVKELNEIICNRTIKDIYTQEKDKLFLHIPSNDNVNFHLIISANAQFPFVTTKEGHFKAKKNTKNFLNEFLPDVIQNISIASNDRVIKIELTKSLLFFLIRGSATNVIFLNKNNISSFKKVNEKALIKLQEELDQLQFINTYEEFLLDMTEDEKSKFTEQYRFVDKDIQNEMTLKDEHWKSSLLNIIDSIFYKPINIFYDEKKQKPVFQPVTFLSLTHNSYDQKYDGYFDAVNKYMFYKHTLSDGKNLKVEIDKFLNKKLGLSSNKLNNLKARLDIGSKESEYSLHANLLLANIGTIKKGMKEIEVEDYDSKSKTKIIMDEKLSPSKNVEKLFEKARSEKINYEKTKEIYNNTRKEYSHFIELKTKFDNSSSYDELITIKKELKIRLQMKQEKNEDKINFRHFIIEDKYHLYVGKDSKNNDLLTTRFAKQNDYWFHARSVSGSHVVLRVETVKEGVPKSVLKKAASIAAFYSKAKSSKLVSVSFTFKKYVSKSKNMPLGQVSLLKEQVLLVSPEIPKDCIYIESD